MAIHGVAKLHWTGDGITHGISRIRYRNATGIDLTTSEVAASVAAVAAAIDVLVPNVPSSITMSNDPEMVCYDDATGVITSIVEDTAAVHSANGSAAGSYASGVGARMQLHTPGIVRGRRVQGAIMVVPLEHGGFTTDGNLASGTAANIVTAGNALIDTGGGTVLVVWTKSKPARGVFPALVGLVSDVEAISCSVEPAVLRRRRF